MTIRQQNGGQKLVRALLNMIIEVEVTVSKEKSGEALFLAAKCGLVFATLPYLLDRLRCLHVCVNCFPQRYFVVHV